MRSQCTAKKKSSSGQEYHQFGGFLFIPHRTLWEGSRISSEYTFSIGLGNRVGIASSGSEEIMRIFNGAYGG